MHYLYRITNHADNDKVYIGQSVTPERRWKEHQRLSFKNPVQYIHRAMAKYGIDKFQFEIIAQCLTQEDADHTEIELIKQYDSRNKEKGYNLASGGSNGSLSPESIEKRKQFYKDHPEVEQTRANKIQQTLMGHAISDKVKIMLKENAFKEGHKPWQTGLILTEEQKMGYGMTGKTHNETTKLKISLSKKGKKMSEEQKRKISESMKTRNK